MLRPLVACAVLLGAPSALAQTQSPPPPPAQQKAAQAKEPAARPNAMNAAAERAQAELAKVPAPKPEDVRSVDAILTALYDVISGPAGAPRDWQRMRSLFYPGARLVPVGRGKAPGLHATALTVEDFISGGSEFFATHGFYEKEFSRQMLGFGDLVQALSAYETREAKDGPVTDRGANSIQLFNDGKRWWVLNITWLDEKSAGMKLPTDFTRK
jgi:hypothetical protein